jgi:TraM recognition site of TraD and TraG
MSQRSRRQDRYPWTWEMPLVLILAVSVLISFGVHLGRAVANLLAGCDWRFPSRVDLFSSLPAVLRGDARAGLVDLRGPGASPSSLFVCVGATELILLAAAVLLIKWGLDRWGPGRMRGVATSREETPAGGLEMIFNPAEVGWHLGRAHEPRGGQLWVPWDRTAGVIGPQGSGKTLDLLLPALLGATGAALVTLTKVDDLLLSFPVRSRDGRSCLVLDPFGLARGLPELVWDPIAGCVDPMVAERRAKAFTAGTIKTASGGGYGDGAARFYAAEAAKVIQAFFHAAALTGRTLDDVLRWVANPTSAGEPAEILLQHPHAAPYWLGLLHGALHGDDRTAGNTITTAQQAMSLFFQEQIRRRCRPSHGRPATDLADVIRRGGTIYLLGREDPYASASPLMTAVAEHVLDTALGLANKSPWGRLCPPLLACLDELPSTVPLPTLQTRMANERALGISFIYAAQTWRQLAAIFASTRRAPSSD